MAAVDQVTQLVRQSSGQLLIIEPIDQAPSHLDPAVRPGPRPHVAPRHHPPADPAIRPQESPRTLNTHPAQLVGG
jgi:hypothetical protein